MKQFDDAIAMLGKQLLLEEYREEIERAISNVKRSGWDKWFRRKWYQATWQIARRQRRELNRGRGWWPCRVDAQNSNK